MAKMYRKYERLLISGEYANENELCNALGLNYEDLYEDERAGDEDTSVRHSSGRGIKPLFPSKRKGK